jgi:hypothetical protein
VRDKSLKRARFRGILRATEREREREWEGGRERESRISDVTYGKQFTSTGTWIFKNLSINAAKRGVINLSETNN